MARTTKSRPHTRSARSSASVVGAVSSTRNASFTAPGLSAQDGASTVATLQERLGSLIDLALTLKHIHWNVVGPAFIGVHHMLDPQHAGVQAQVDATAERIATLGGVPNGLAGHLVSTRTWDDYGLGRADSQAHLAALDLAYRSVIAGHRDAIAATESTDPISQDMLIGQTGELEQYHWFVRTHLEDYAGGLANAGAVTEVDAARSAVRKTSSPAGATKGTSSANGTRAASARTTS